MVAGLVGAHYVVSAGDRGACMPKMSSSLLSPLTTEGLRGFITQSPNRSGLCLLRSLIPLGTGGTSRWLRYCSYSPCLKMIRG